MKPPQKELSRILVVEDDENLRALVVDIVRRSGCEAVSAQSGEQALSILRDPAEHIDWLLTDIRLGGAVDGWVVGSEFSLAHPLRPIIYMSGVEQDSRSRAATNSIFLQKPVDVHQLLRMFRELAGASSPGP
jgi:DNA-binding NtrC family response regulator